MAGFPALPGFYKLMYLYIEPGTWYFESTHLVRFITNTPSSFDDLAIYTRLVLPRRRVVPPRAHTLCGPRRGPRRADQNGYMAAGKL